MKYVFDLDGTLTEFTKFVDEVGVPYFEKNYKMKVVYSEKLELEDKFDMINFYKNIGYTENEAQKMTSKILKEFWVSPKYLIYLFKYRFKKDVRNVINQKIKKGHKVEIHTSRAKSAEDNFLGKVTRFLTRLQLFYNGVKIKSKDIYFYENDDKKIKGINESEAEVAFDDKIEVLDNLSKSIKKIHVADNKNEKNIDNKNFKTIDNYNTNVIESTLKEVIGERKYDVYNEIVESNKFFDFVSPVVSNIVMSKIEPIIMNECRLKSIDETKGVVIAPNHLSTIDPLIITSFIKKSIHWAALARFFDGRDSIFNNSKNPLLCKVTSYGFNKLGYFPIERIRDNKDANNLKSIKNMYDYLMLKEWVGIFPEGTTRKNEGSFFGDFDKSFLKLAKKSDSTVVPILTYKIKDESGNSKYIFNVAKSFKVENMTIEEAFELYMSRLLESKLEVENELCNTDAKIRKRTLY